MQKLIDPIYILKVLPSSVMVLNFPENHTDMNDKKYYRMNADLFLRLQKKVMFLPITQIGKSKDNKWVTQMKEWLADIYGLPTQEKKRNNAIPFGLDIVPVPMDYYAVKINIKVTRETDKAVLGEISEKNATMWLPKSQIQIENDVVIGVNRWFADKYYIAIEKEIQDIEDVSLPRIFTNKPENRGKVQTYQQSKTNKPSTPKKTWTKTRTASEPKHYDLASMLTSVENNLKKNNINDDIAINELPDINL